MSRPIPFFGRFTSGLRAIQKLFLTYDVDEILPSLLKFNPDIIYGRPSYLRLLAERADKIELANLKIIMTSGEFLDNSTRSYLTSAFNCDVYDSYGSNEFGVMSWECCEHQGQHVNIEGLVVETIKDEIQVAPGERGAVLVTGLLIYVMPLIRYKIGDIAVQSNEKCSCNRGLPLIEKIEGRIIDHVEIPDGRQLLLSDIIPFFYNIDGISKWQVVQRGKHILVKIALRNSSKVSIPQLKEQFKKLFNTDVEIDFIKEWKMPAKFQAIVKE
jgi:phenylacetate-CoA ligase